MLLPNNFFIFVKKYIMDLAKIKIDLIQQLQQKLYLLEQDLFSLTNNNEILYSLKIKGLMKTISEISKVKNQILEIENYYIEFKKEENNG